MFNLTLSILAIIGLWWLGLPDSSYLLLPTVSLVVGTVILILAGLIHTLVPFLAQKAEQERINCTFELFQEDPVLIGTKVFLSTYCFISFLIALNLFPPTFWITSFWILLTGIALTALTKTTRTILNLLDPYHALFLIEQKLLKAIPRNDLDSICQQVRNLCSIGAKASQQNDLSLTEETIKVLGTSITFFAKSFFKNEDPLDEDQLNKLTYATAYILEEYEMIFDIALTKHQSNILAQIIVRLGRWTLALAIRNPNLASLPLSTLASFADQIQELEMDTLTTKIGIVLEQLAKSLATTPKVFDQDISNLFEQVVHHLHEMMNELFKKNKKIPIKILTAPFLEIKTTIMKEEEPHPQSQKLIQILDAALSEFSALESVIKKLPLGNLKKESSHV